MKKIISLIIITSLCVMSLVGCGNKKESNVAVPDKGTAISITMEELNEKVDHNQAKAGQYIDNNTYAITGYASEIYSDYVVLFAERNENTKTEHYEKELDKKLEWEFVVYAYMSSDDLAKIDRNDRITVYGFFTEVGTDDMDDKVDRTFMKLDNAQF